MFSAAKTSGPSGYNLTNSLRFRGSASAYLNRTTGTSTSATTWTWSAWVKRGSLGTVQALLSGGSNAGTNSMIYFDNTDVLGVQFSGGATGIATTAVYRDPASWYHIVVKVATTTATIYVNNTQVATGTVTPTYINAISTIQYTGWQNYSGSTRYFDGYLSEVNFVDGQALTPSSFGSTNATTNVWQPAKYTGTYGTNGFYLNFSNIALTSGSNTGLGKDFSGNGNYWNTNNISVTAGTTYDAMIDVPTLTSATVANYCVINPIASAVADTYSQANLKWTKVNNSTNSSAVGSIAISSGKWYWEGTVATAGGSNLTIGIGNTDTNFVSLDSNLGMTGSTTSYAYNGGTGPYKQNNNTQTSYGATYTANDVIGVAFDADAGTITFYKNNVSQGTAYTGITGTYYPACGGRFTNDSWYMNFGQRPFSYTPPTGFVALNTYNLPTPTILQGNKYMDATLYTGTGASNAITNSAGFKPDIVWIKARSTIADHIEYDSTRGASAELSPNQTAAEATVTTRFTSFNTNGFTVTGTSSASNANGVTFVGWQWVANGGTTSSNTSGTITSTVQANTTAGFSVVTYTGTGANATVGHGLGVAPKMVIVKRRDNGVGGTNWFVWHTGLTSGAYGIFLNLTNAQASDSTWWNSTIPTSSVFNVGTSVSTNGSGGSMVAYCWADVSGYSKAFSYTGNGSTDGSFVYTGFLPRFVLIKRTDTTGDWYMWDTARNTYDVITNTLLANSSAAETSATSIDALSNGFKLRNTTAGFNASGGTYIGMAWATNPFKNSNAF